MHNDNNNSNIYNDMHIIKNIQQDALVLLYCCFILLVVLCITW